MALYLIDGHALAYRSYFAFIRNPLTNSRGENTSAVYGFIRAVIQLQKKYSPDCLAVVFDSEEETERHREYPEYKSQREEMPDELSVQLDWIVDVLEAMGIPVIMEPGHEADDILATIAKDAASRGEAVKIVTGDKDFFQLLSGTIHLIRPGRGTMLEEEIGPEYLKGRFGLEPGQVVDLLALMGDSSDNIPGVRGIGEKNALKLLHQFGSLDAVYEHLDEVEPAHIRKKLEEGRESAMFSRDLVTLRDVPLEISNDDLLVGEPDEERLSELLLYLEFHQILQELSMSRKREVKAVGYTIVKDEKGLRELADLLTGAGGFTLDTETTSIDAISAELVGISFCTEPGKAWYVPVAAGSSERGGSLFEDGGSEGMVGGLSIDLVREVLGPVLASSEISKIGHNIKYDLLVLEGHGFAVNGISFDTMIASYCIDPARRSHSLDALALEFCRHRMIPYKELFAAGDRTKDIRTVPVDKLADYSCEDADYTMRLKEIFDTALVEQGFEKLFNNVEMPLSLVLAKMERAGVAIDTDRLGELSAEIGAELDMLKESIHRAAGEVFNINSNKQLQHILFEKLGLPAARRTKTGYSTDVEVLRDLAAKHEIAALVLEYRQLAKLAGTYVDALPKLINPATCRIHTSFNQTVTATGRLSSSDPNLQNIPIRTEVGRKIRSAFVPAGTCMLMDADYSQIELRIMAHLSGDPALVEAFREGRDVHTGTAARIHGVGEDDVSSEMRSLAKTINYGVIYGMGARGLARQLGISVDEAKGFIEEYFDKYPGVRDFIDESIERARENGYAETLLGRKRPLPDIGSGDGRVRSFSERIAVNMPIQGTAADMIKIAMIDIDREIAKRGLAGRMILQVHDELVFEVPADESKEMTRIVRKLMESAIELDVPLVVDIRTGSNWLEAH
jgi:DNA polymerase-1